MRRSHAPGGPTCTCCQAHITLPVSAVGLILHRLPPGPPPRPPQVRIGNYKGEEVHVPFSSLLPMVHPNDFVLGGWDISGEAAGRLLCTTLAVC